MDAFVKFYGSRKPQDAAGVFFQMGEVYEKQKKIDDLARTSRLPREVGRAGRPRPPGAGALPPGRDGLEGVVPEGLGGRRLPGDRTRCVDAQPEGPRRRQQEAGAETSARSAARPTKSKIVVFDRNKPAGGQGPRSTSARRSRSGRAATRRTDHRQGRRGARGPRGLRGGGRRLLPRREALRGPPAREVPGGPRLPAAVPVRQQAPGGGREEDGGVEASSSPPTSRTRRERSSRRAQRTSRSSS